MQSSSNNFIRKYHAPVGKFVYKHKGSGLIVDNIFKPLKSLVNKIVHTSVVKKALTEGRPTVGERTYTKHGPPVHGPPLWTRSMDHPVDHP